MTTARQALGRYGERRAAQHLVSAGLRVVARNWRCARGEIDIIAWDGEDLVFCEVKTRRSTTFGSPAEAVVAGKARRLRTLAAQWLADTSTRARGVRFDVIEVYLPRSGPPRINHIVDAF